MERFLSDIQYQQTSLSSEILEAPSRSEECAVEYSLIKIGKLSPPDENHAIGTLESGRGFSYWRLGAHHSD